MSKKSKQTQASTSEAGPWKPAVPVAKEFLGQLQQYAAPGAGNVGINAAQKQAFGQLEANAAQGNPYAGQIDQVAQDAFNTVDHTGTQNAAYSTLQGQLGDYASGKYLDPMSNPQMQAMLTQVGDDVGNRINAQFAGAGRDMSGANQMAYGRGVTQAQLPLLLDQWNKNQANQMSASQMLYGAGNQTAQTNAGLDAQRQQMRSQGSALGQQALDARNYGANSILDLTQQQQAKPFEDMSLIASLLLPTAGLGGTEKSTGTSRGKMGLFSDARLKEDIKEVGALADGQRVYAYAYKDDPEKTTHIGVMAQEAEKQAPTGAVGVDRATGFKVVDYDAATRRAAAIVRARKAGGK